MKKIYVGLAIMLFFSQSAWAAHKKNNHANRIFLNREDVHKVEKRIWILLDGEFYIARKIHFKGHLPYIYKEKIRRVKMGPYFRSRKVHVPEPQREPLHFEYPVNYQNVKPSCPLFSCQ